MTFTTHEWAALRQPLGQQVCAMCGARVRNGPRCKDRDAGYTYCTRCRRDPAAVCRYPGCSCSLRKETP